MPLRRFSPRRPSTLVTICVRIVTSRLTASMTTTSAMAMSRCSKVMDDLLVEKGEHDLIATVRLSRTAWPSAREFSAGVPSHRRDLRWSVRYCLTLAERESYGEGAGTRLRRAPRVGVWEQSPWTHVRGLGHSPVRLPEA